ncbi:Alpha/Beta hydrolase protein, partial [Tribonema minus]
LAVIAPPLIAMARLSFALARPYLPLVILALAALNVLPPRESVAAAAVLATALIALDEQLRLAVTGRHDSGIKAGLYTSGAAGKKEVIKRVPALRAPFYRGTPWMWSGDLLTLLPYVLFGHASVRYERRWLMVPEAFGPNSRATHLQDAIAHDNDNGTDASRQLALALDIAVPEAGHDPAKPFYIVLHGLNGSSAEPYLLDFVRGALGRGSSAAVLIARGLGGTPCADALFHGARVSDVDAAVNVLRRALGPATPLALVGFSIGGIIASNYLGVVGARTPLNAAVSLAGSFDTRANMSHAHSRRAWQPLLAIELKRRFVAPNAARMAARGVDPGGAAARARDVVDFDSDVVAPYHGYKDVYAYYEDMSAGCNGKHLSVAAPLLAVQALDDPIMCPAGLPIADVDKNDNLWLLVTQKGGHIGWAEVSIVNDVIAWNA